MQVRRIDSDLAGERRRGEAFTVPDLSKLGRYWISHDAIIRQSLLIVKRYQPPHTSHRLRHHEDDAAAPVEP